MFRLPSASRALSAGTALLVSIMLAACSSLPEMPRIDTSESTQSSSSAVQLAGQSSDSASGGTVAAQALAANAQASHVADSDWDASQAHLVTFSGTQATTSAPGGTTIVWGPVDDGNGALDADGQISMTGGTVLAVGSAGMAMTPGTDGLGWVSVPLEASAGSEVTATDEKGQVLTTFTPKKSFQNLLYVSDTIEFGKTYTVTSGGSTSSVTAGEARGGMGPGGPGGPGGGGPAPR